MKNLLNKLNGICIDGGVKNVCFFDNSNGNGLISKVKEIIPYGNVLLISLEESLIKYGKDLIRDFNKKGNKIISVVTENKELSIDNLSMFFNAPEDVRGVIVLDRELLSVSSYFCQVKGLPLFYAVNSVDEIGVLPYSLYIKSLNSVDEVVSTTPKYIGLSYNVKGENFNKANAYGHIISKISCLVDYRLYSYFYNDDVSTFAYNIAREVLTQTLNSLKGGVSTEKLLEGVLTLELANYISKGVLFNNSACVNACKLYYKDYNKINGVLEFTFYTAIMELYQVSLNVDKPKVLNFIDYNERVDKICKTLSVKYETASSHIKKQISCLKNVFKKDSARKTFQNEIAVFNKYRDKFTNVLHDLGSEKVQDGDLIESVYLSGDLPNVFNGITFCREDGILEIFNK